MIYLGKALVALLGLVLAGGCATSNRYFQY